jgi:hypothetical protein
MEWIKAKYDRLLLGLFGLIALAMGAMILIDVLGFKKQFASKKADGAGASFGAAGPTAVVEAASAMLKQAVEIKAPEFNGKPASLFASAPVLKTADNRVIGILDPASEPVRPPLENKWAFLYDIDLRRQDIAEVDLDSDGYTNAEEFQGKSNPRDRASVPPFYTKIVLKDIITDDMTLKFATYQSDSDITINRTEPAALRKTVFTKVGEPFTVLKDGKEPMFKVTKVEIKPFAPPGSNAAVPTQTAIIEDLRTPGSPVVEIPEGQSKKLPSFRAKFASLIGNDEKVGGVGAIIEFSGDTKTKYTIKSIDPASKTATLEFTENGKPASQAFTIK